MNKSISLNPKQSSTVVGGWAVAVGRALDALGYDGDQLLQQAGVDLSKKLDTEARFDANNTRRLWQLATAHTQQEDIGLQVAQYVCPTTFHALGFSLWASSSLMDALQRMVRFDVLLNSGCDLSLSHDKATDQITFTMSVKQINGTDLVAQQGVDYFLGAVMKMFRDMSGQQLEPVAVHLCHATPSQPQLWQDYFDCPVSFTAAENQLVFKLETLSTSLPTGNALLAQENDKLVENYLQRLQLEDITARVRSLLIELMPMGLMTLEDIAAELSMEPRTLQYQLQQQGTSMQALRDQIREELARQYLQHSLKPITEIAYSLGFSAPAHFNRACKRWTGLSPSALRQQNTSQS
jgi:AraC-like DNA-binding protein